ncbi:probable phosphoglycerate mutase [Streptomyces sp. 2224.1]|uniref:bifunctional RNase H/acid phosphatase n=1 Tax=unclassified Streptomyces TaxID=2593676 RepID=UPI00088438D3|nr:MULTISPECIES: bifunctional RNase H/acid phosphatase [unclassified Streptomyces]PBC82119.1 putative phosphoglycerate mutase [Streptomyces sp. 2321.6]SDR51378.1 probable phosphoglycerate mutase [Streptomyces sp. KS_16]SEC44269.1 probable phosphoglycerate mutase [Streptomyces sp. 2133.1]SEC59410.1 probable phosphoglycerate mutase [Streptomyces sp. 2224.1]SEF01645.1 probable phosphoglycerate mutase [Streptomyces sp. 2112.3]
MSRALIVEADGGSRGNPGPAGYGAVVLDPESGEALAEAAEFIGTATNNVAEYKGLVAGLRAAHAIDPQARIRVRMDSKLVVEQMSGRWKIKHPDMKPLAAEAGSVFPPGQVTYEWIPRAQNKHADRLANEAMDAGKIGRQWEPGNSTAALATAAAPARSAAARAADEAVATAEEAASSAVPAVGWGSPDLGPPATFVLLRHGETPLTPEKRFSGSGGTDPALSAAGRRQAEATAAALAARGTIQAVVSSPLRRCRETAGAVADRLGLEVRIEEGLRETDFGAWEGLTFAEVRERHPDDLDAWLGSAKAAPTGGGESFATVARRVAVARDKLLARYAGKTVLVVTHVTPVKTLVRLALGAPPESLFRMELSAASLSVVAYYSDGNASLRLLNDTSHLR